MVLSNLIKYYPLGDAALVLDLGDVISTDINSRIQGICRDLDHIEIVGLLEYVPAFTTITIYYDPELLTYTELCACLEDFLAKVADLENETKTVKIIPVWYDGQDLDEVERYTGLDRSQIITLHTDKEYLVYMIGFVPGFPYLGGMDKRLSTPRREAPRLRINAGSVGIAGEQTGVYPLDTPGGWQIIGQTPLNLFDIRREKPSLLSAGDTLRFVAISKEEFLRIKSAENGN
ncbi:5-oxoprolinase subunit PxpB [Sphingobacterium sp. LRF_L2]|uniref:5-oxoprolinase subunit PxpB n=1 Tax=Sphingobacterium sp. LRF_L2 TaxID=3369421 RepID=UPI003F5DB232